MTQPHNFKSGLMTIRDAEKLNELQKWIDNRRAALAIPANAFPPSYKFQAKITAYSSDDYTWVRQAFDTDGEYIDDPVPYSGGPSDMPAKERNGLIGSVFPFYAELTFRVNVQGSPYYEFDLGASRVLRVLGRTGDLSPVTKLTVNNAVLTGTAADAILTPDVATGSLAGIVSLSDQVMGAGEKTFEYILLSEADSYVDMGSGTNTVIDAAGSNSIVCIAGQHAMNLGASYADVGVQPQAKLNFYGSGGADELDGWIDCFEDETNRYMELRIVDDDGVRINSLILNASGASLFAGTFSIGANLDVTGSFALSGDISPAQLTANTNDWNPTGW